MIEQSTIDNVFDLALVDVVKFYGVDLKKKGASFMAKSPFTEEKTASFSVHPAKGCWKCFSSGKGGASSVSFVMQLKNMSYPDAIRDIANAFNIEVKQSNTEETAKNIEKRQKQFDIFEINAAANDFFQSKLREVDESLLRMTYKEAELEGLGFADDDFGSLFNHLLTLGYTKAQMITAGLVSQKEKGTFDVFNNRVMFPVYKSKTQVAGFSGRRIDGKKEMKYLNTKDTEVFTKGSLFLGFEKAVEAIHKQQEVIVVEGNYDVSAIRLKGMENVLASAGTALTESHVRALKKMNVKLALIFFDADSAGEKASLKAVELFLSEGIHPEVVLMPEGFDPDSFFTSALYSDVVSKFPTREIIDGLRYDGGFFVIDDIFKGADTVKTRALADESLERFLVTIEDERIRSAYIDFAAKEYKVSKTELKRNVATSIKGVKELAAEDQEDRYRFPRKLSPEEKEDFEAQVKQFQFYEDTFPPKIGYWFVTQYNTFEQASNFLIKPFFHINSEANNRRLVEIQNHKKSALIEVPSKGFVNMSGFTEECINHMAAQWLGSVKQFKLASLKFLEGTKEAVELTYLGWQPEGFFSFADGVLMGKEFKKVDDYGIIDVEGKHFYLPAFSKINRKSRNTEDKYESDRALAYQKAELTFEEWAVKYHEVFGDNGMFSIAFLMAGLFRDFIQRKQTYFPLLFNFGAVQTGKSSAAQFINAVFHGNKEGVNLNSITHPAFSRKLGQFANVPIWLDEFRNDLHEVIRQGLKALYDGIGRDKSKMSQDGRTTNDPVRSPALLSGQYYPAGDDNALTTRCVILTYTVKTAERSHDESAKFMALKELQEKGLSSIVADVLQHRDYVEKEYLSAFSSRIRNLKDYFDEKKLSYDGRVLNNYCTLLSIVKIFEEKIKLPFKYKAMETMAIELIQKQSESIHNSDILQNYWKIVEYLFIQGQIGPGHDYKIEATSSCKMYVGGEEGDKLVTFEKSRVLLYIQFKKIHPLYLEAHQKQFKDIGTPDSTIRSYMKTSRAYVGVCNNFQFKSFRTSALIFDYEMIKASGIDLEHSPEFTPEVQQFTKKEESKEPAISLSLEEAQKNLMEYFDESEDRPN